MTLAELVQFIRQQLREEYQLAFDDLLIKSRINQAYVEIANHLMCFKDTRSYTSDTSGIVTIPDNLRFVIQVIYNNQPISRASIASLDAFLPNWRTLTGSAPQFWLFLPPNRIQLIPRPATGTFSVSVHGIFVPASGDSTFPLLVNDTDEPKLPESAHLLLAYRAIMELAQTAPEDQTLQARANYYAQLYVNGLQSLQMTYRLPIDTRGLNLPVIASGGER